MIANNNYVKVHLYCERPMVYLLEKEETRLIGRIDCELRCSKQHGYKTNDIVEFIWDTMFQCWEAVKKVKYKS